MSEIVVGVDGSEGSRAALVWAIDEARRRGTAVRAVLAWQYPVAAAVPFYSPMPAFDELEKAARESLEAILEGVDAEGVEVHGLAREGTAAGVLLAESGTAELLVVGTRGLGGFKELLLGSTSHQVAHHAHCPVVIVPPAS